MSDLIYMANGKSVPKVCVDALTEFDLQTWPGATFPNARPAIVAVVLEALIKRTDPDLEFVISKEDLTTDRPDMISVVREELRKNVVDSMNKKEE